MSGRTGTLYRPVTRGSPSPTWWGDFTVDGKRVRFSTGEKNREDAERALDARIRAAKIGAPDPSTTVPTKFRPFKEVHLADKAAHEDVTPGWLKETRHQLDRAEEKFGSERRLGSITPQECLAFDKELRDTGLSSGTRRHYLNALSNMFAAAVFHGVAPSNPVANIPRNRKPRAQRREAIWMEPAEVSLLLEAARTLSERPEGTPGAERLPFAYPLLATFALTGGELQEVLGLEVEDFDFDAKTVTFRWNEWRRLKNNTNRPRTLPMFPQLEAIVRGYLLSSDRSPSKLMFPNFRTGKESMVTDIRKLLARVQAHAGTVFLMDNDRRRRAEPEEVSSLMFRHSFAAAGLQLLDHGKPISPWKVAREWLGHSSTAMLDGHYGHAGGKPHRSENMEFRIAQHRTSLKDRLRLLDVATSSEKSAA